MPLPALHPAAPFRGRRARPAQSLARRFADDRGGAAAVEFAIVAMPFILLLMAVPQMAIYFLTQSSLDTGVIATGDALVNTYYVNTTPTPLTPASLKAMIVAKSGGFVHNDATVAVDLRKLANLDAAVSPIANTVDTTAPKDVIVVRAQAAVTSVVPFLGTMYARSSVIVRRQAL